MDEQMLMAMAAAEQGGAAPMPMGPDPMMGAMGGAPADEDGMVQMLMMALQQGWDQQEGEIDAQKQQLIQMLMQMLQSQAGPAVDPMMGYAEGAQSPVAGPEAMLGY